MKSIQKVLLALSLTTASALVFAQSKLKITIIGDSTVCNYASSKYPQAGWGQVLDRFFTAGSVTVNNRAIGGRSSRSFYQEGRWADVLSNLENGEYVFIQFGHNDRDFSKEERYTDTSQYKEYLRKYVNESRKKGAIPVLISPMNMNAWNGSNVREVFCEGANNYRGAMLNVSKELNVPFIDLEKKSVALQKRMGQNYCAKFIYLGLDANEYPNFADGSSDGTHFQEMGANFMAKFVCEGIEELKSLPDMAKLAALLKPLHKLTVLSNKSDAGMITEDGNTFPEGVSITLKVKPNAGESFKGWYDYSDKIVSTSHIYTFTMPAGDVSFIARFQGGKDPVNIIKNKGNNLRNLTFDRSDYSINISHPFSNIKIELFSINGRRALIKQISQESESGVIKIPLKNLNEGNYILKTTINGNETVNIFRYLH